MMLLLYDVYYRVQTPSNTENTDFNHNYKL